MGSNQWRLNRRPGKSHIATALGVQAIEHHRCKVRFYSTVELVNALEQNKALGKAGKLAEMLTKIDLVTRDEPGKNSYRYKASSEAAKTKRKEAPALTTT